MEFLKNKMINLGFKFVAKKLDGYKAYIGSIGTILLGLAGLAGNIVTDIGLPVMEPSTAYGLITGGFAALGLGHKIEKADNHVLELQEKKVYEERLNVYEEQCE